MKLVNILGVEVADISHSEALSRVKNFIEDDFQHYITTPNPEIVLLASKNQNLRLVLNHSDLSLPDGFGLKIASIILGEKLSCRIPGSDFSEAILVLAEQEGWPVFLLGSKNNLIVQKAVNRLKNVFSNIKIVGAESGGEIKLENGKYISENDNLIDAINESGAKILFVGFGCPKQEKWIFQNLDKLPSVKVAMTIGGTIDFWAGEIKRANPFFRKFGIEWMWRLFKEPSRAKRIWNATFVFLWETIKWRFRMCFVYRKNSVAFIVNENDEVFLIKRLDSKEDHWQLPQGGIDHGENAIFAAKREAKEETGITEIETIGECSNMYVYEWPSAWHKLNNGFKGQEQTIVYFRYLGDGSDIVLDSREACDFEWVSINNVVEKVFTRRKQMAKMAVEGYNEIINQVPNKSCVQKIGEE